MYEFYGKHILAEYSGISEELINNVNSLISETERLIAKSGATLIETKCYHFFPRGYTIICILKESHVSLHSYPEYGAMFLDAFTCGSKINPYIIVEGITNYLVPFKKNIRLFERYFPDKNCGMNKKEN